MPDSRPHDSPTESVYRLHIWEEIIGQLTAVQSSATDEISLQINGEAVLIHGVDDTDPNQYIGEVVSILRTETRFLIQVADERKEMGSE